PLSVAVFPLIQYPPPVCRCTSRLPLPLPGKVLLSPPESFLLLPILQVLQPHCLQRPRCFLPVPSVFPRRSFCPLSHRQLRLLPWKQQPSRSRTLSSVPQPFQLSPPVSQEPVLSKHPVHDYSA